MTHEKTATMKQWKREAMKMVESEVTICERTPLKVDGIGKADKTSENGVTLYRTGRVFHRIRNGAFNYLGVARCVDDDVFSFKEGKGRARHRALLALYQDRNGAELSFVEIWLREGRRLIGYVADE